jgi:DNA-binding MarR family transcriptional regulator
MKKQRPMAATQSLVHLLHRAGQRAEDLFAKAMSGQELTARQYIVLSIVASADNPSQTDICDKSGIDRSTLAEIVHRLVSRGLLARHRTQRDARKYAVRLTAQGTTMLDNARPAASSVDQLLVRELSAKQRADLEALLKQLVSIAEKTNAAAAA